MKILVTGATGFIGCRLSQKLVNLGHEVIGTGTRTENDLPENIELLECHFNGIDLSRLTDIDLCFHNAALNDTTCYDKEEMMNANVHHPLFLFNHLNKNGCEKFIFASSTAVYGNTQKPVKESDPKTPLNVYGESKLEFERKIFDDNSFKNKIALRYCNVYGPGESHKGKRSSMIFKIYKQLLQDKNPKLFSDGTQERDWCYVDDVIHANIECMKLDGPHIFNVGSGIASSFLEINNQWNKVLEKDLEPDFIDNPYGPKYQNYTCCDLSLIKSKINYNPINLENGISSYYSELKKQEI